VITVLLAEDHRIVRDGLRLLVNGQTDMTVVGEVGDGEAAVEQARALRPNVVVLDVTMPGMNGLAAAKVLQESVPTAAVVALTRHDDHAYVRELMAAGAVGYVLKQSASIELLKAIRAAVAGERYIDPAVGEVEEDRRRRRPTTPSVTDRERDVLRRMAAGQSNKEIASALDISIKTVEVHKANAMRKLDLHGRVDVVRYAALNGWLQDL
jgi:two-component system, NarL family, response regulator NreC